MKCEPIDTILKTGKKDEILLHVEHCLLCRQDYLSEDTYRLLACIPDKDEGELFWLQQRTMIMAKLQAKRKRLVSAWFKYAAAILLPLMIVVYVYEMRMRPIERMQPIAPYVQQPQIIQSPIQLKETAYPAIDDLKNPEARYYKIELDSKTQVIMIVDSNLDL
ncbi:MAG: hypothetical protein A2Y62_01295 [Candidatus Fischerbacteria bacterium RBG_13_37_8]|uniref:Uncharacterized protein n=1 Tax=Candidatus Fischerbacteria bacterium RBG_13_37_8 TaxID=1817863 RepID=A0A1F5VUC1_9BACT|nr:MAG: hypothetical protein A2Y62_01295 [Candidatus Fischerbacteria bacterium RBG_13_37_8]